MMAVGPQGFRSGPDVVQRQHREEERTRDFSEGWPLKAVTSNDLRKGIRRRNAY
jgi:hypothetical protein